MASRPWCVHSRVCVCVVCVCVCACVRVCVCVLLRNVCADVRLAVSVSSLSFSLSGCSSYFSPPPSVGAVLFPKDSLGIGHEHRTHHHQSALQGEVGPMGCNVQIQTFLLSFRQTEMYPEFDLCANGRRVLALGFARLASAPFRGLPVHLVLCNDVLAITTRVKSGVSVVVTAPVSRDDIYCDPVKGQWEDDFLRLWLPHKRQLLLSFGSTVEKEYWIELLTSKEDYTATEDLNGVRLLSPVPRQVHELAALLGVPNPFTTYGDGELKAVWKRVPKVCFTMYRAWERLRKRERFRERERERG